MNTQWKRFLEHAGAECSGEEVLRFGASAPTLQDEVLTDLSYMGLIRAKGEHAQAFLQAQFSSNVNEVSATHSQLSAYCNPKGRMLASFRILKRGDTFLFRLPRALVEPTLKRLLMFVLRAKVTLEDTSDSLLRIGYAGPGADEGLKDALGDSPRNVDDVITKGGLTVVRVPGPVPRFELYGEFDDMQSVWKTLATHATPAGAHIWKLLDIHAGIPNVLPETAESFVPQMANLDLIGGVSFSKGCYPGQEIVARMRYLGTLKRRMYRIHLDVAAPARPADPLFAKDKSSTEPSGTIVDAQAHPDGGVDALAVIQIADAAQAELHLGSPDGAAVALADLPYSLEVPE